MAAYSSGSHAGRNILNSRCQLGVTARGSEWNVMTPAFIVIKLPLSNAPAFTGYKTIDSVAAGGQLFDKAHRIALTRPCNDCQITGPDMYPYGGIQNIAAHCTHRGTPIWQDCIIDRQMTEHNITSHHHLRTWATIQAKSTRTLVFTRTMRQRDAARDYIRLYRRRLRPCGSTQSHCRKSDGS